MVEWKYTLFSAHSCPPVGQSQPKVRLCRRIDPDQAGSCEQVLPCLHHPHVQFVLSDPQRRSVRTSVSRASQPCDRDRAAARDLPGWTAQVVRKAEDGERELVPMSWGFVLLQDGKAPRRVTNVRDDNILTSRF